MWFSKVRDCPTTTGVVTIRGVSIEHHVKSYRDISLIGNILKLNISKWFSTNIIDVSPFLSSFKWKGASSSGRWSWRLSRRGEGGERVQKQVRNNNWQNRERNRWGKITDLAQKSAEIGEEMRRNNWEGGWCKKGDKTAREECKNKWKYLLGQKQIGGGKKKKKN